MAEQRGLLCLVVHDEPPLGAWLHFVPFWQCREKQLYNSGVGGCLCGMLEVRHIAGAIISMFKAGHVHAAG